jgi:hypothetical protein
LISQEQEKGRKTMIGSLRTLLSVGTLAAALPLLAAAQMAGADAPAPPTVPDNLRAPDGNVAFFKAEVQGTQNYICMPSGSGFAWTFFAPQATGFVTLKWYGGDIRQQVITHFLSANQAEGGTARPTWQSSFDTSAVWGKSVASSSDSNYVAAGAIPWLLLQVMGSQHGTRGSGVLADATFVQRLNTAGGVAPATGCSQAEDVGAAALVPYTANYYFFKPSPKN